MGKILAADKMRINKSISQSFEIFSVAQIDYYGDHESVNGETTVKCGETIYEIIRFSAVDGKQLKRVMTGCPVAENFRGRMLQQETSADQLRNDEMTEQGVNGWTMTEVATTR